MRLPSRDSTHFNLCLGFKDVVWVDAQDSCNLLVFGNGWFVEMLDEEGTGMNVPFSLSQMFPRKSRNMWISGFLLSAVMERLGWG